MLNSDPIVIVGYARTPIGGFQGDFVSVSAPQLGAAAIREAVARSGMNPHDINEVLMGCVLPAGVGQAPTRQATLGAGLSEHTGATTISKVCGSGMRAVMFAHDQLVAGSHTVMVAGGMESMTNTPYLLPKARIGMRMGHGEVKDHMFLDGLEDAYDKGKLMGVFAEACATKYDFSRKMQDDFAITSLERAQKAITNGLFKQEVVPVLVVSKNGERTIDTDEQPLKAKPEKIPTLKPAFAKDGTITAANASSISDGAAALILMRESEAKKRGTKIQARILAHATHAQAPAWFTTAPVGSIEQVCAKAGWLPKDVDLFEINEAFAVVTLAAMKDLNLPHEKVNVHGGACALGHPIGASGARIIVTLLAAMEHYGKTRGVASLCIGGGEATAIAIERPT